MESTIKKIRTRFAPSPTGWMHLGNVRIALLNKLFAEKHDGDFILRIEDTDLSRDVDPGGAQIIKDLAWLGLTPTEGPYYQSKRTELYQKYLNDLIQRELVYRCFETTEELETKRQRQIARGLPPRYDRAALKLSKSEVDALLAEKRPFVWRFKLPQETVVIKDLSHGNVSFDLDNFSDFTLTRQDGSFTFIFANFVDDVDMHISHVIRGGDHLTNTAVQAALYKAFSVPLPLFYHTPLLCNAEGKKLSKRDFGFSLDELRQAGFLPEAICNYLGIIGASFKEEIMDMQTLVKHSSFEHISHASQVRYDVEKLRWINQKWIAKLLLEDLVKRLFPIMQSAYPSAFKNITLKQLSALIEPIKTELVTLNDCTKLLHFIFEAPHPSQELLQLHNRQAHAAFFKNIVSHPAASSTEFLELIKQKAREEKRPLKEVLALLRIALTGAPTGLGITEIGALLELHEIRKRMAILTY